MYAMSPRRHDQRRERRESGALESEVMAALWADGPMTAGQVHAVLGSDALAYKTVLTVLTRLHDKGLLEREKTGRAHEYRPRRGPAETVAERMAAALAGVANHPDVLQHFIGTLEPDDAATLRALLERTD